MPRASIVVTGALPDWASETLESEFEVRFFGDTQAEAYRRLDGEDVVAVISRGALPVDAEFIRRCPHLKVIAKTGVGMDAIDVAAATKRGIPVLYTPGALSRSVAEHALALMLALLKRLPQWQTELRAGDWNARYNRLSRDLSECRVGIVGYGRIGTQLRRLLRPFGCPVAVCDPYLNPDDYRRDDVDFMELDPLLALSDIVSLHVPLTEETQGLIDAGKLQRLPSGAILINTARGAVVDGLDELEAGLQSGALGGVGLDVFAVEPPDVTHPLFWHPRAILTGHVASRSQATQRRIISTVLREVAAVLAGRRPTPANVVNF